MHNAVMIVCGDCSVSSSQRNSYQHLRAWAYIVLGERLILVGTQGTCRSGKLIIEPVALQDGRLHSHPHLEKIILHNLLLLAFQLLHVPGTAHIPILQPLSPLFRQPHNGIST